MTYTIYKSTDPDAPQLSNATGSLKTVLKACLVTGYGTGTDTKAGAGWNLLYDEPNKAVFQPVEAGAENLMLRIDNYAVSAYSNMTDINTGTQVITPTNYVQNTADWFVIATTGWLFMFVSTNNKPYVPMFFGNVDNLIPEEQNKTVFLRTSASVSSSQQTKRLFGSYNDHKHGAGGFECYTAFNASLGNLPTTTHAVWCDIWLASGGEILGKLPILKAMTKHLGKPTWHQLVPQNYALDMSDNGKSVQMVVDLS